MEDLVDEIDFMVEAAMENIENAIELANSDTVRLKIKRYVRERLESL